MVKHSRILNLDDYKKEALQELSEITQVINTIREKDIEMNEKCSFLQTLIDSLPNPLYVKDKNLKIQFCNKAFEIMMRIDRENIIGKSLNEIFPNNEAILKIHYKDMDLLMKGGSESFQSELFPDGKLTNVIFYKSTYRDTSGNIAGLVCSFSDISEIIQKKKQLKLSEEKFSKAFNISPLPMTISDYQTGRLLDVNQSFLNFLKIKRDEIIGLNAFSYKFSDGSESLFVDSSFTRAKFIDLLDHNDGQIINLLLQIYTNEKEVKLVKLSSIKYPINAHYNIFSVIQDITDETILYNNLLSSEKKYKDIFENVIEGIFQTTPDGRYISANPAFSEVLGYDSPNDLINSVTNISEEIYVNSEDRKKIVKIIERDGFVEKFITRLKNKKKGLIWVSINAKAVKDMDGRIIYYEGTMEDITKLKDAEQKIYESDLMWQNIFDVFPDAIIIVDTECNIIKANKLFCQKIGKTSFDILGNKCYQIVHNNNFPPENCPHNSTMIDQMEHSLRMDNDLFGKNVLVTTTPLFDSKKTMIGSVHIIHMHE